MAITRESIIQNLYSTTVSAVPDSNLQLGEIAINSADEAVFIKNSGGTVKKLSATSDLTNNFVTLSTTQTVSGDKTFSGTTTFDNGILFEGATANVHETTLTVVDPTADNTITLPDSTGTVALTNNKLSVFAATTSAELAGVISNETGSGDLVFGTSPTITTSMVAGGSSFDLINTTATGVNFAGAATTLSIGAVTGTATINNANTVVTGDLAVNGGDITTSAVTATVFDTNATTVTAFRSATTLTLGATSGTSQIRNDTTIGGDLTITGGDLFTSAATSTLMNTTATNLSVGGAATTLTIGATSGTAAIRNLYTKLGTTTAGLSTNSGTTNSLTVYPYGDLILSPLTTAISAGGTNAQLTITNTNDGVGAVQVAGGDLYLGTKNTTEFNVYPVNIIFEGATDNGFETTLTVTDPTADRTITLPNLTGTVALTTDLSQFAATTSAQLAGVISDETGSGALVFATSPTLVTPILGAAAATSITADAYILSSSGIQAKTASYTLVAGDNGKIVTMNVASANTLTVPASLNVGFNCTVIQIGAGQTTITASSTTLNSYQGYLKISGQHGSASIVGYTSNVYNVAGNLSA
jgi:hypothetical protein